MLFLIRRLYRGETNFDFIGSRRRWYLASGVIIVICILSFIIRGFNWGVEFKGGSQFQIAAAGTSITAKDAEAAFSRAGIPPIVLGSDGAASIHSTGRGRSRSSAPCASGPSSTKLACCSRPSRRASWNAA